MRESGVGSPTTAYRWIAAYHNVGEAWQDDVTTRPARRVPVDIAEQIIALRERYPTWGKVRIAQALAMRYGAPVVSPTGVRSVLREAGLWEPADTSRATGEAARDPLDQDRLLDALQRGIQLDLFSRPLDALQYLEDQVFRPLQRQPHEVAVLLQEPVLGSWLLRGGLQLAHALLDTGRWASALRYLRLTESWLSTESLRRSVTHIAYQDAGDRWICENDRQWRTVAAGVQLPPSAARISLRHDDIWLEAQRYLGIVLRDSSSDVAEEILSGALRGAAGRTSRQISPLLSTRYEGIFRYNLAALKLRRGYPDRSIMPDLAAASELLAHTGDHGMLGSAVMLHAKVLARQQAGSAFETRKDILEQTVWTALDHAERATALVSKARLAIEGTDVLLGYRNITDDDRIRLERAARLCIAHGFRVQARKLLENPRFRDLHPEFEPYLVSVL